MQQLDRFVVYLFLVVLISACTGQNYASKSEVSSGELKVETATSPDIIDKTIRKHLGKIKYCYEKQLTAYPNLEGMLKVDFVYGRNGLVQEAKIRETTLNNEEMQNCILKIIIDTKFPPVNEDKVEIIYPFTFKLK
jgi:hypothetical protein